MKARQREYRTARIVMRAKPALKQLLEREAARRDSTISDIVRHIVNAWVREQDLELRAADQSE
jgi:hypothetical protein